MAQNDDEKLKAFLAKHNERQFESPVGEWNRIRSRIEESAQEKPKGHWLPILATAAFLVIGVFFFQNRDAAVSIGTEPGFDAFLTDTYSYLDEEEDSASSGDDYLALLDVNRN